MYREFLKLCTPARIYFILAVIVAVMDLLKGMPFMKIMFDLFFAFVWTIALDWFCKKISPMFSWVLVVAPFILPLLYPYFMMPMMM
jgi:hypothetical protein